MAQIMFLVDDDFEQVEYTAVRDGLQQAGHETRLIALNKTRVQGWNHTERAETFLVDGLLQETDPKDFDALVLPGGVINADTLRVQHGAQQAVQEWVQSGKVLGAICHAPWLLISAGVVQGRTLTAYYTLRDDLHNAGAHYVDEPCVVDGVLITSREPKDIPQFVQAMVAHLQHRPEAQRSALMQSPLPRQSGAPSPSAGLPTAADFDALVPASSAEQHSPQAALPPQPSVPQPGSTPTSDQ